MVKLIGISGKKQSGKTSLAYYMKAKLLIKNDPRYKDYEVKQDSYGDVALVKDNYSAFVVSEIISPIVEVYSFGDALKQFCIDFLGLSYEQCYGTDEQKNTFTEILWDNMPKEIRNRYAEEFTYYGTPVRKEPIFPGRQGKMTAREVLQVVGTDLFRSCFGDKVWVNMTFKKIKEEDKDFAFIADCRFPIEIETIFKENGNVIRLGRIKEEKDTHSSETSLDDFDWSLHKNCHFVDNSNMTMKQKNEKVENLIKEIISPI